LIHAAKRGVAGSTCANAPATYRLAKSSVLWASWPGIRFSAHSSVSTPPFSASLGREAAPRVMRLPALGGVSITSRDQLPPLLAAAAIFD
jgi:hypothetical protein